MRVRVLRWLPLRIDCRAHDAALAPCCLRALPGAGNVLPRVNCLLRGSCGYNSKPPRDSPALAHGGWVTHAHPNKSPHEVLGQVCPTRGAQRQTSCPAQTQEFEEEAAPAVGGLRLTALGARRLCVSTRALGSYGCINFHIMPLPKTA